MISFINLSLRVERIAFRTMCVSAGRRRIGCVKAHSHWPVSREALQSWPILAINIRFISLPSILGQIPPSSRNIFRAHPFVSLLTWDHPNLDNLPRDVWQTRLNAFVDILLLLPFPSSFQWFPFPHPSRTCYSFNRHMCCVAYYALPRFNLYPLRRISWKVEQRTEVE